jgi:hypothetical protein
MFVAFLKLRVLVLFEILALNARCVVPFHALPEVRRT